MHHFQYQSGELYCENVPVSRIAAKVGTPFYLYSAGTLTLDTSRNNTHIVFLPGMGNVGIATTSPVGLFDVRGGNAPSGSDGRSIILSAESAAVAEIKNGLSNKIILGNLDSKRDWGYAKDYVEAMWLMLQQDEPDDYVIATGETHTVREFLEEAFGFVNLNWEDYVEFDERFLRPAEVDLLVGDYSKAKEKLGWEPKVKFKELVKLMVEADLEAISQ